MLERVAAHSSPAYSSSVVQRGNRSSGLNHPSVVYLNKFSERVTSSGGLFAWFVILLARGVAPVACSRLLGMLGDMSESCSS
jgi:hypothetical protein